MDPIDLGGLLFVIGVIFFTFIMVFALDPKMWTSQVKNWRIRKRLKKGR